MIICVVNTQQSPHGIGLSIVYVKVNVVFIFSREYQFPHFRRPSIYPCIYICYLSSAGPHIRISIYINCPLQHMPIDVLCLSTHSYGIETYADTVTFHFFHFYIFLCKNCNLILTLNSLITRILVGIDEC